MDYLDVGGHRLEYEWVPPAAAPARDNTPTLVFLHEGLGCIALWKSFPARVCEATGCSALVYSRVGYGRSDPLRERRDVDYLHREALDSLPIVLDRLGVADPILIGHSDGASIALIHTGSGMRPVRGLVLIAPHVFVEELTVTSIRESKEVFANTDLPEKLARHHADAASTFWGWNDIWLDPRFLHWNIESYLPSVVCPVLLIQAADDPYGTLAQLDEIERQVRGPVTRCVLTEGAHSPHLRQQDETVRATAQFVRRVA